MLPLACIFFRASPLVLKCSCLAAYVRRTPMRARPPLLRGLLVRAAAPARKGRRRWAVRAAMLPSSTCCAGHNAHAAPANVRPMHGVGPRSITYTSTLLPESSSGTCIMGAEHRPSNNAHGCQQVQGLCGKSPCAPGEWAPQPAPAPYPAWREGSPAESTPCICHSLRQPG